MTPHHLFVYGTLMRAVGHPMHHDLAAGADFVGDAHFNGRLYQIDTYPGVVELSDPQEKVFGELYALRKPDQVLTALDAYEGCGPQSPTPTEFMRVARQVHTPDGTPVEAWIYLYNRPIAGLRQIVSGRFLLFAGLAKS